MASMTDLELIQSIEKMFSDEIHRQLEDLEGLTEREFVRRLSKRERGNKKTRESPPYYSEPVKYADVRSFCCNDVDKQHILEMIHEIKSIPAFTALSKSDIIKVLIFSYYALRYDENIVPTGISGGFLERILQNKELSTELFLTLTTKDLMVDGINISSEFRKQLFGIKRSTRRHAPKSRKRSASELSREPKRSAKHRSSFDMNELTHRMSRLRLS